MEVQRDYIFNTFFKCENDGKSEIDCQKMKEQQNIVVLKEFISKKVDGRDSSHNLDHMVSVAMNCLMLALNELNIIQQGEVVADCNKFCSNNLVEGWNDKRALYILVIAGLLHDVPDHKYVKDVTSEIVEITNFLHMANICNDEETTAIIFIIQNCSYSKRIKGLLAWHKKCEKLQKLLMDADMLEALGPGGIDRCYAYQRTLTDTNGKYEEEIIKLIIRGVVGHCHEKLLKLKDLMFTKAAKYYAQPMHKYLEDYVTANQSNI